MSVSLADCLAVWLSDSLSVRLLGHTTACNTTEYLLQGGAVRRTTSVTLPSSPASPPAPSLVCPYPWTLALVSAAFIGM